MTGLSKTGNISLAAYSGPMIAMSIVNMLLIAYLPNFYAAEIGISIATVGLIFMGARAFDAVIDPVIGNLSDRTRSRWGRRKPWLAFGVPAFMVTTWMFFQPPVGVGMTYLLGAAFLFYVTYALVIIPYVSWGAEIRRDYEGRTKVNSMREGAGILGTVIATLLPVLLLPVIVGGEPGLRDILWLLALTIIVILAITIPLALKLTPQGEFEPVVAAVEQAADAHVACHLHYLAGRRVSQLDDPFLRHQGTGVDRGGLPLAGSHPVFPGPDIPAVLEQAGELDRSAPRAGDRRNGLFHSAPRFPFRGCRAISRGNSGLCRSRLHDPRDLGDAACDRGRHRRIWYVQGR
jgi:hypothetical protein